MIILKVTDMVDNNFDTSNIHLEHITAMIS